jgi:hypothetical protein
MNHKTGITTTLWMGQKPKPWMSNSAAYEWINFGLDRCIHSDPSKILLS